MQVKWKLTGKEAAMEFHNETEKEISGFCWGRCGYCTIDGPLTLEYDNNEGEDRYYIDLVWVLWL